MSWADDDERLWQELQAATRQRDAVPPHFAAAAEAAFTWRTVDAELMALTEDAASSGATAVRGVETAQRRVLEFRGALFSITMELAAGRAEGQMVPTQACRLMKASLDGEIGDVEVDDSGYFHFPVRDHEKFRLQLEVGDTAHVTEWVTP